MQHGDLVRKVGANGRSRLCIALRVTKQDIRGGCLIRRPGLWLFAGYWYGTDPLKLSSFGKLEGRAGKVCGRVRSHNQVKKLKI